MITIALGGDVMLGRGVGHELRRGSAAAPWGDLLPLWRAADLRIVNLECAITTSLRRWARTPKRFHFRGGPHVVRALLAAGIDAVSLANNHTLDFEAQGLADTLAALDRAGIAHAGAGRNLESARAPAWLSTREGRVALIAITDNEPAFAATPDAPGTDYLPAVADAPTRDLLAARIAALRRDGAGLVVLANHCGPNWRERPPEALRAFARALVGLGVDLYHGHSAHVLQGVEILDGKPVLYGAGDLIDDYAVDPLMRNDRSGLFFASFAAGRLVRLAFVPVSLSYARAERAQGAEREAICRRFQALSAELGTRFVEQADGLVWTA